MDIKQIQDLIRFVAKSGVSEVQLEKDDFKIIIKTGKEEGSPSVQYVPQPFYQTHAPQQHSVPQVQAAQVQQPTEQKSEASASASANTEIIKSPMIGTLYRKPAPDKEPFVKVGDKVTKGQVVCVIEAMKLFNEIESDVTGTIVKILAEDSSPVEYDQPLFLVELS